MKAWRKRAAWALVIVLLAGAGINITSRVLVRASDPGVRLVLNIPASRLDVYEAGQLTNSYPVSAGARGFQTPAGNYRVHRIVWNPWWHPPDSKWAQGRKPEPPGPTNPMGRVKLQFANLLYIHGTTAEDQLGAPASHGCVRMSNSDLIELTRLLHEHSTPPVPAAVIEALRSNPRQTRVFQLRQTVPLAVNYDLVEVRNRTLVIHPNVYRVKDADVRKQVLEALEKEGVNVNALDKAQLDRITRVRNATRLRVSLDTLLNGTSPLER